MPTLVDEDGKPATGSDVDGEAPSSGKTAKSNKSKRTISSPIPDATANQQAIAAANLAAAVQMAASLQMNGLLSLLTQSSAPGSASAADPTVLQTTTAPKANAAWQVPTPQAAQQAALKMATDIPPFVHLSKTDSAPQLKILDDRLTLKGGMRGYRMSRATHGVAQGHYYYEVLVLEPPSIQEVVNSLPPNARLGATLQKQIQHALDYTKKQPHAAKNKNTEETNKPGRKRKAQDLTNREGQPPPAQVGGHLRIGWSMRTGDLQAPVGYDKWSYGFRNIAGSKIHQSRREDNWGGEAWGPGDVVGCAIFLNTTSATANDSPSASNGNQIRFFKNGAPLGHFVISKGKREGGAAYEDIQPGTYYPAISSYLGGSVQVNFGPHFIYPPRKLPHGMSGGKLQPVSSLQAPPLSETELLQRLKKKTILRGDGNAFKESVLAESKVLQETYQQHRLRHVQFVLEERQARNLNTADLRQELQEMEGQMKKEGEREAKHEDSTNLEESKDTELST